MILFIKLNEVDANGRIILNNDSLPLVDYGVLKNIYIGIQYNPITTIHSADKYYEEFVNDSNETAKQLFLKHIDRLLDNALHVNGYLFFYYNFLFPDYHLKPPWYSAMAQGEALPRLIDAYKITNNSIYLDSAKKAMNVLFININNPCECGVTYKTFDRGWWYEEYANGNDQGPRVLNGMMYTLLDLYNYYDFTNDNSALFLFNQGKKSLVNDLQDYDKNGNYSSYDKNHGYAPTDYHYVHVCLLGKLYNITGDTVLKSYHDKWESGIPLNESYTINMKKCL